MSAERIRDVLRRRDALPINAHTEIIQHIRAAVNDPQMNPAIPLKVARAVVERRFSQQALVEILIDVRRKRAAGELRKPGAYFLVAVKNAFARAGETWT